MEPVINFSPKKVHSNQGLSWGVPWAREKHMTLTVGKELAISYPSLYLARFSQKRRDERGNPALGETALGGGGRQRLLLY